VFILGVLDKITVSPKSTGAKNLSCFTRVLGNFLNQVTHLSQSFYAEDCWKGQYSIHEYYLILTLNSKAF